MKRGISPIIVIVAVIVLVVLTSGTLWYMSRGGGSASDAIQAEEAITETTEEAPEPWPKGQKFAFDLTGTDDATCPPEGSLLEQDGRPITVAPLPDWTEFSCKLLENFELVIRPIPEEGNLNRYAVIQRSDVPYGFASIDPERSLFEVAAPLGGGWKAETLRVQRLGKDHFSFSWLRETPEGQVESAKIHRIFEEVIPTVSREPLVQVEFIGDLNIFDDRVEWWKARRDAIVITTSGQNGCEGIGGTRSISSVLSNNRPVAVFDNVVMRPCDEPVFSLSAFDPIDGIISAVLEEAGTVVHDVATRITTFVLDSGEIADPGFAEYRNDASGFRFLYPAEWFIAAGHSGDFRFAKAPFEPHISGTPRTEKPIEWLGFRIFSSEQCDTYHLYGVAGVQHRQFGDVDAVDFTVRFEGGAYDSERRVVACRNGATLEWRFLGDELERVNTFETVLDSFEFLTKFATTSQPREGSWSDTNLWQEWGSSEAGYHLRIPGEPTSYACNPGSEAYFYCVIVPGSNRIRSFGTLLPATYQTNHLGSCGSTFDECVATYIDEEDVVSDKQLDLPSGIRAREVRYSEEAVEADALYFFVEHVDGSGIRVHQFAKLDAELNEIYDTMLSTIQPWSE